MRAKLAKRREQLTAMRLELLANQATCKRLRDWYGVFVFTGGDLPSGRCDLAAMAAYSKQPFAADRISGGEIVRYRRLVESALGPRPDISTGPKTLRSRMDIGDAFDRALAEIQSAATTLESALTKLLRRPEASSPVSVLDAQPAPPQSEKSQPCVMEASVVESAPVTQEHKQQAVKPIRSVPKSCGMPRLELRTAPAPGSIAAEDGAGDLDEINTMMSEGGPPH